MQEEIFGIKDTGYRIQDTGGWIQGQVKCGIKDKR
jgi:hypothetical protein